MPSWSCSSCGRYNHPDLRYCSGCNFSAPIPNPPATASSPSGEIAIDLASIPKSGDGAEFHSFYNLSPAPSGPLASTDSYDITKSQDTLISPPSYAAAVIQPDDLPIGWEARVDDWNRTYYVNHYTQLTQWEHPGFASQAPAPDQHPGFFRRMSTVFAGSAPTYQESGIIGGGVYTGEANRTAPPIPNRPAPNAASSTAPYSTVTPYPPADQNMNVYTPGLVSPQTGTIVPVAPMYEVIQPVAIVELQYNRAAGLDVGDMNVLTHQQLESVPHKDVDMNDMTSDAGCSTICCDTISRSKCLTFFSVIIWAFVVLIAISFTSDWGFGAQYGISLVGGLFYFFYFILFVAVSGCSFICWLSGCGKSHCVGDYPVEALMQDHCENTSTIREHLQNVAVTPPTLTLHVECYHHRSSGSGKNRRTRKVVTYRGTAPVQVTRWRDISAPANVFADAVDSCKANTAAVSYFYTYEVHPSQLPLIEGLKKSFYNENCHRDTHCSVWYFYTVGGHEETKVHVITKEKNCTYNCSRLCVNPFTFNIVTWAVLYLPYIMIWKFFQRPISCNSIKYLHISPEQ